VIDPYGRVIDKADIFHEAAITTLLPHPIPPAGVRWPLLIQYLLPLLGLSVLVKVLISKK
jgi:hypothetical protein